jgi:hypothetical protein
MVILDLLLFLLLFHRLLIILSSSSALKTQYEEAELVGRLLGVAELSVQIYDVGI